MMCMSLATADPMSLDDLFVAILNQTYANAHGETVALYFDDIGMAPDSRSHDGDSKAILEKFAIGIGQTIYRRDQLHIYRQMAASLVQQGRAFVCTCVDDTHDPKMQTGSCSGHCVDYTPDDVARIYQDNIPYLIRLHKPDDTIASDLASKDNIPIEPDNIGEVIIIDRDNNPSKEFATAIDEMLASATLLFVAHDHANATPIKRYIHNQLGYTSDIQYIHLPAIRDRDSSEHITIESLLQQGYLPDAIVGYLIEIAYGIDVTALPSLDLQSLPDKPLPSIQARDHILLDTEHLKELNHRLLSTMDDKAISSLYGFADVDIGKLIKLHLSHASTISELDTLIKPLWAPKPCDGALGKTMSTIAAIIRDAPYIDTYADMIEYISVRSGIDIGTLEKPLRLLITARESGPDIALIYKYINPYLQEVAKCQHSSTL